MCWVLTSWQCCGLASFSARKVLGKAQANTLAIDLSVRNSFEKPGGRDSSLGTDRNRTSFLVWHIFGRMAACLIKQDGYLLRPSSWWFRPWLSPKKKDYLPHWSSWLAPVCSVTVSLASGWRTHSGPEYKWMLLSLASCSKQVRLMPRLSKARGRCVMVVMLEVYVA